MRRSGTGGFRWPGDRCPVDFQSHSNAGFIWNAQPCAPSARIPEDLLPVIARAAVAACDKNDGLADGIIADRAVARSIPNR
jgi:hypothetical protein